MTTVGWVMKPRLDDRIELPFFSSFFLITAVTALKHDTGNNERRKVVIFVILH